MEGFETVIYSLTMVRQSESRKKSAHLVSSKTVYRGPVFSVTTDCVQEPGIDQPVRRDVVRHQGSVVVLAVDERRGEPRVLLARQYRHAAGRPLWELPAGRIDRGESALAAAKRELLEETGITAHDWRHALTFYSSPGFLDETMAIYLARGLSRGTAQPEEDEMIANRLFPLSQAVQMAVNGRIPDAKTIAALLWYDRLRQQRPPEIRSPSDFSEHS
jgi:ADP-ribose pyrophosphatase